MERRGVGKEGERRLGQKDRGKQGGNGEGREVKVVGERGMERGQGMREVWWVRVQGRRGG